MSRRTTEPGGRTAVAVLAAVVVAASVAGVAGPVAATGPAAPADVTAPATSTTVAEGTYDAGGTEAFTTLVATPDGGSILAGETTTNGSSDGYVVRLDRGGRVVWERTLDAGGDDAFRGGTATADGGAVLVGEARGGGWAVRLGADGDVRWRRTYGEAGDSLADAATVGNASDAAEGYVLVGRAVAAGADPAEAWVVRTEGDGRRRFSRTYGGAGEDAFAAVTARTDVGAAGDGFVAVGRTGSNDGTDTDAYVFAADGDGDTAWTERAGGAGADAAAAVARTVGGGVLVAGTDGDVAGDDAGLVVAFDDSGERRWIRRVGGGERTALRGVAAAVDGAVVVGERYDPVVGEAAGVVGRVGPNGTADPLETVGDGAGSLAAATLATDGGVRAAGARDGDGWFLHTAPDAPGDGALAVTLLPSDLSVGENESRTVDVVADDVPAGVGAFDVTVRSATPGVARVTNATPRGAPSATAVRSVGAGRGVRVRATGAEVGAGEDVVLATVVVRGRAAGATSLAVDAAAVVRPNGTRYGVAATNGALVRVSAVPDRPPVAGDARPTDPDGDGRFEDVNGDESVGVGDVIVLFRNRDAPAVTEHPDAYDFSGDGSVGVGDVVALFRLVVG